VPEPQSGNDLSCMHAYGRPDGPFGPRRISPLPASPRALSSG